MEEEAVVAGMEIATMTGMTTGEEGTGRAVAVQGTGHDLEVLTDTGVDHAAGALIEEDLTTLAPEAVQDLGPVHTAIPAITTEIIIAAHQEAHAGHALAVSLAPDLVPRHVTAACCGVGVARSDHRKPVELM
ncbi:uncharacterized protein LOC135489851 isoform X7 [Lineus longissimus]|uniref:uncharacterized protein LOC135489851 isoform X7 n=1 Tax=Lineus longissimus TaxID=88925 RepID=UPI00315D81F6